MAKRLIRREHEYPERAVRQFYGSLEDSIGILLKDGTIKLETTVSELLELIPLKLEKELKERCDE